MTLTERLRPLFTPWTAGAFIAGFLACMYIAYPPRCGWGDNKWGDVATWFSGLGTFFAGGIALWIALRDSRERAKDKYANGMVFAVYIYNDVSAIEYRLTKACKLLVNAANRDAVSAANLDLQEAAAEIVFADVSRIEREREGLGALPSRYAAVLVRLPDTRRLILDMADKVDKINAHGMVRPDHLRREIATALDMLRPACVSLKLFLAEYAPRALG